MGNYIPLPKHRERFRKHQRIDLLVRLGIFGALVALIVLLVIIIGALIDVV